MDAIDFFATISVPTPTSLSEKAAKVRENIIRWPSHIPKGPLFTVASLLIDEPIPPEEKGFQPFSIRRCLNGAMADRFGAGTLIMCLPKYGEANQAGVTAEMLRDKIPGKHAVIWDYDQSEPASRDEVAQFMREAFGI